MPSFDLYTSNSGIDNGYNPDYDIPDEKLYPFKEDTVINPSPKSIEEIKFEIEYAINSSDTSIADKIILMRVLKSFDK